MPFVLPLLNPACTEDGNVIQRPSGFFSFCRFTSFAADDHDDGALAWLCTPMHAVPPAEECHDFAYT